MSFFCSSPILLGVTHHHSCLESTFQYFPILNMKERRKTDKGISSNVDVVNLCGFLPLESIELKRARGM